MDHIPKKDWKIFRSKLSEWQERYMSRIIQSYQDIINTDTDAFTKFFELKKRIRSDAKDPIIRLEMSRSMAFCNLDLLLNDHVITEDDLSVFSELLQKELKENLERHKRWRQNRS